ncbi:MAG: hypothetical protein QOE70_3310 [Chthoniobacter sp.]|jgi:hypothetical protein|nr:hypothetical protein [Chthoniobacter sp.]
MKPRLNFLILLAGVILISRHAAGETPTASAPATGKTIRLLTVGNSFSQNATRFLKDLAKADGNVLIQHAAVIGGGTMEQHWEKVEQIEKDPKDQRGFYTSKKTLKQELLAEPWDFVTIQQASIRSHDVTTYRPYAKQLYDFIKKHSPRAEVILHETWAYRSDDPRFAPTAPKPGEPATRQAMYESLASAYRTIATELSARIIPVGDAFDRGDTDPKWGYQRDTKFDFKTASAPALPDQTHSLHMGWRWQKGDDGKQALRMDGHHASPAGEYLGGCVFYEVLFGKSVVGNAFIPPGLDPGYARFLQETAHQAVVNAQGKSAVAK